MYDQDSASRLRRKFHSFNLYCNCLILATRQQSSLHKAGDMHERHGEPHSLKPFENVLMRQSLTAGLVSFKIKILDSLLVGFPQLLRGLAILGAHLAWNVFRIGSCRTSKSIDIRFLMRTYQVAKII